MNELLGDRLKRLRKSRKLTLDQLAKLTGSSKSYLSELENKNPPRPSAEKLSQIADALRVTADYLLGKDDEELASAEDKAFYKKYRKMSPEKRKLVREISESIDPDTPSS